MFGNIKKYFFFLLDATGPVLDLEAREVLDLNVTLEGQSCWLKGFCLTQDCVFCDEFVYGKNAAYTPCCLRARHKTCWGEQCPDCQEHLQLLNGQLRFIRAKQINEGIHSSWVGRLHKEEGEELRATWVRLDHPFMSVDMEAPPDKCLRLHDTRPRVSAFGGLMRRLYVRVEGMTKAYFLAMIREDFCQENLDAFLANTCRGGKRSLAILVGSGYYEPRDCYVRHIHHCTSLEAVRQLLTDPQYAVYTFQHVQDHLEKHPG